MGAAPNFELNDSETAASMPTGGMMPEGADAVVMIEDTAPAGDWIEVRRAVQRGENVAFAGEEVQPGEVILRSGERISRAALGTLAAFGVTRVKTFDLRVGVISTGDEVVGAEVSPLPLGCVRDANSHITVSVLREYGWQSDGSVSFPKFYGIARDSMDELGKLTDAALSECDVVLLSGGSSVGARDYTMSIMERLHAPGLLIRGINMTPGKPTLIGGDAANRKLMVGLPGHPLSCMVASLFVTAPLLLGMIGSGRKYEGKYLKLPAGEDIHGRTGPDEFVPMRLDGEYAVPLAAKSGYVSAMMSSRGGADGFIRMRPHVETLRREETAEVWLW
jgi:molybdopterin molybdotransferase